MTEIDELEVPGLNGGHALRFQPYGDTLRMSVGGYAHTVLERSFLRPLAAWFAGEAEPVTGPLLTVRSDGLAVVRDGRTTARLDCRQPYGAARVSIACTTPYSRTRWVLLSPDTRLAVAEWLRRVDAEGWARPGATA